MLRYLSLFVDMAERVRKDLHFLTINDVKDMNKPENQRLVRSSAARHHWARAATDPDHARRSRRRDRLQLESQARKHQAGPSTTTDEQRLQPITEGHAGFALHDFEQQQLALVIGPLSASRADPFHTYPVPWNTYVPALVDHCEILLLPITQYSKCIATSEKLTGYKQTLFS